MGFATTLRYLWRHPLGRRRPLRTLARYVGWQTVGRLRREHVLDPWVNSSRLHVEHGMTGATGNYYVGLHEFEEMAFLLHLLRPGDLFVDVGANVGSYTVLAGAAVGARVIAFEPVPATFRRLKRNIELNGLGDRVDARPEGISHERGVLVFTSADDTMNHVATEAEAGREDLVRIPVVSLEDALGDERPLLIKVDVEGHERSVFRGARRWLSRPGPAGILVEDGGRPGSPEDPSTVRSILGEAGFVPCRYDPWSRSLDVAEGGISASGPPLRTPSGNSIHVRGVSEIRERLRTAPPARVLGLSV